MTSIPLTATIVLARGVLDTTPQAHASGTRLIGIGEWLASEGAERAPGESVFVGATPRTSTDQGDPVLAANGQPMVLAGRQALPYPPGRIRLNGQTEPAVVAGDLTVTWAHRDRTQQTAYLVQQDEVDIGPELGVTYTVHIRNRNGVLAHTETGLLGTAYIWTAAVAALDTGALGDRITLEVSAERDGLKQLAAAGAGHGSRGLRPALGTVLGRCVMEPRIDVHLLTLNEPANGVRPASPASKDAPIQLHVLPGIPGRIGEARAAGYAQGTLPLVSFVDPDDLYEASAFTQLADALDACPQAVMAYTDEALTDENGQDIAVRRLAYSRWQHANSASHVHGLIVMRRSAVEAVLKETTDLNNFADWLLTLLVAKRGGVLYLPIVGRHWRQHPQQSHRTGDPEAVRHIRQASNLWR